MSKYSGSDKIQIEEFEAECRERLEISEREIVKLRNRLSVEISNSKLKDA